MSKVNRQSEDTTMSTTDTVPLGSYVVDMEVRERVMLVPKWITRQIVLTGQTLEILSANKLKYAFNTAYCTTQLLEPLENGRNFPFQLLEHEKVKVTLNAPTASARDEFIGHLEKSLAEPGWQPQQKDTWGSFISVATAINEKKATESKLNIPSCGVTVEQVQKHLRDMKDVYDIVAGMPNVENLYEYLLTVDKDYTNGVQGNFAHIVHLLHPMIYIKGRKGGPALADIVTRCPRTECRAELPLQTAYLMHVRNQTIYCPRCGGGILYETFMLAQFVKKYPSFKVGCTLRKEPVEFKIDVPPVPRDGKWSTFLAALKQVLTTGARSASSAGVTQMRNTIRDAMKPYRSAILGVCYMDLVQGMFRQLDFINKICPHFEYWMNPAVIEASIYRYEKFMYLMTTKDSDLILVPTSDIDLAWHTHQTSHSAYVKFCQSIMPNRLVVDHDDTIEGGDLSKGYADTFVLWSKKFGEAYSSFPPSYEAWVKGKSDDVFTRMFLRKQWAKHGSVPSKDNRYYGVNEAYPVDAIPYAVAVNQANANKPDNAKGEYPVYVTVIGTPVMDGRVRQPYSRNTILMYDAGLPYYYMPYIYVGGCGGFGYYGAMGGCGVTGTAYGSSGGCGTFAGDSGGCGAGCGVAGCASGGCASGCGGDGGGDGGGGGCGGCGGCGG